jgi:hypothetical protein
MYGEHGVTFRWGQLSFDPASGAGALVMNNTGFYTRNSWCPAILSYDADKRILQA